MKVPTCFGPSVSKSIHTWYFALMILALAAVASAQKPSPYQSTTGPTPPPGIAAKVRQSAVQGGVSQVLNVPAYLWHHGCGPTAVGMVVGYYDGQGFDDLIPGDASTQTASVDNAIASEGSIAIPMHYEDYALPIDTTSTGIKPDKSAAPAGDEHSSNCIADFMKTSFSSRSNYYGWSWSTDISPAFIDYVNYRQPNYQPAVREYYMASNQLTWEVLTGEIDNGRPMVFVVDTNADGTTDHFVTVVGYQDSPTRQYGCLDTWDPVDVVRWCTFQNVARGHSWGVYAAWAFDLTQSGSGTVTVDVTPDTAPWTLSGPPDFTTRRNQVGAQTFTDVPIGDYTITYEAMPYWVTPSAETKTLAEGETISFTATYEKILSASGWTLYE